MLSAAHLADWEFRPTSVSQLQDRNDFGPAFHPGSRLSEERFAPSLHHYTASFGRRRCSVFFCLCSVSRVSWATGGSRARCLLDPRGLCEQHRYRILHTSEFRSTCSASLDALRRKTRSCCISHAQRYH